MINEARARAEFMRGIDFDMCVEFPEAARSTIRIAADMIESLAAELEQVKQERDGLNILLAQAQSMLETRTRERDAAVGDMKDKTFGCEKCKHYFVGNRFCDMPIDKRKPSFGCWQWRGVKEEGADRGT